MRIGFDLDGVIAEISIPLWLLAERVANPEVIYEYLHIPKLKTHPRELLHKDDQYVIITSRSERYREITREWLESHGISASSLFICDVGVSADYDSVEEFVQMMAEKKAQYIKSECLDVYFEDSPDTVARLRKLCPKTTIIQFGGRLR